MSEGVEEEGETGKNVSEKGEGREEERKGVTSEK